MADALSWIGESAIGVAPQDEDKLEAFLSAHYPDEDFSQFNAAYLVSLTYLTQTMLDLGSDPASLDTNPGTLAADVTAHVRGLLSRLHGVDTSAMDAADLAWLHCRDPQLNSVPASDLALLDHDNEFCSLLSPCDQALDGGLQAVTVDVGGDLSSAAALSVFGVNFPSIEDSLVSLSSSQQLDGSYHFTSLTIGSSGFSGDITYTYSGQPLPLHSLCAKLLLTSDTSPQTLTQMRTLGQLTALQAVVTGTGSQVSTGGRDFHIQSTYSGAFQLDDDQTISSNIAILNSLAVASSVAVAGTVDGVDVASLAGDVVTSGAGLSGLVILGKKTFSVSPTVAGDILATGSSLEVADSVTSTGPVLSQARIKRLSGLDQYVSGNILIPGDVTVDHHLHNDGLYAAISSKYEFDAASSEHELKTKFNFGGGVSVSTLASSYVRGRSWDSFVADVLPYYSTTTYTEAGTIQSPNFPTSDYPNDQDQVHFILLSHENFWTYRETLRGAIELHLLKPLIPFKT